MSTTLALPPRTATVASHETATQRATIHETAYRDYMVWGVRGRMTLSETHLTCQGWTFRGRYKQRWALSKIKNVRWRRKPGANLVFTLHDGTQYVVKAKGPGIWWYVLDAYLPCASDATGLPDTSPPRMPNSFPLRGERMTLPA